MSILHTLLSDDIKVSNETFDTSNSYGLESIDNDIMELIELNGEIREYEISIEKLDNILKNVTGRYCILENCVSNETYVKGIATEIVMQVNDTLKCLNLGINLPSYESNKSDEKYNCTVALENIKDVIKRLKKFFLSVYNALKKKIMEFIKKFKSVNSKNKENSKKVELALTNKVKNYSNEQEEKVKMVLKGIGVDDGVISKDKKESVSKVKETIKENKEGPVVMDLSGLFLEGMQSDHKRWSELGDKTLSFFDNYDRVRHNNVSPCLNLVFNDDLYKNGIGRTTVSGLEENSFQLFKRLISALNKNIYSGKKVMEPFSTKTNTMNSGDSETIYDTLLGGERYKCVFPNSSHQSLTLDENNKRDTVVTFRNDVLDVYRWSVEKGDDVIKEGDGEVVLFKENIDSLKEVRKVFNRVYVSLNVDEMEEEIDEILEKQSKWNSGTTSAMEKADEKDLSDNILDDIMDITGITSTVVQSNVYEMRLAIVSITKLSNTFNKRVASALKN